MKSIDEISREIFTRAEVEKANNSISQRDYLDDAKDRFIYFYQKYNKDIENYECSNCCSYVKNKRWCSLDCFLSDIGA